MRNIIKKHKDFLTGDDVPLVVTHLFLAKCRPTIFPDPRYGMIVSKRTLKRAVDRNRAKRLLRVWIRANENLMSPTMDYIFIIRHGILPAKLDEGLSTMEKALKKLSRQTCLPS